MRKASFERLKSHRHFDFVTSKRVDDDEDGRKEKRTSHRMSFLHPGDSKRKMFPHGVHGKMTELLPNATKSVGCQINFSVYLLSQLLSTPYPLICAPKPSISLFLSIDISNRYQICVSFLYGRLYYIPIFLSVVLTSSLEDSLEWKTSRSLP